MERHIKNYVCIRICFTEDESGEKIYDYKEMLEEFDLKFKEIKREQEK